MAQCSDAFVYLKKLKFIEDRKANPFLSNKVIEPTNDPNLKAFYIKNKGLDSDFEKKHFHDYIKLDGVKRKDIDRFVWEKLPNDLKNDRK